MHHIVSDGWSTGVLTRDIVALYESRISDEKPDLPDLPVQYADFAVWQREWLNGAVLEEQLEYWRNELAGAEPLTLPSDSIRADSGERAGAEEQIEFGWDLTCKLKALSKQEGVTLFMTMLAAYQLVLGRYASQQNFVIGTDIANRNRLETEGLIGFFVNQLVLRADLSDNPSFRQLLARVRKTVLDAYAHQDVPFEQLVHALAPERDLDQSPLFQVKFVLQNNERRPSTISGLEISLVDIAKSTPKFDTLLNVSETESGLIGKNHYRSDLFSATTIRGLLGFYQNLLFVLVEDKEALDMTRLDLLRAVEKKAHSFLAKSLHALAPSARRRSRGNAAIDL
jgi:non-ribosomal peptide synthetase component F